jgi:hypothetical protein
MRKARSENAAPAPGDGSGGRGGAMLTETVFSRVTFPARG